jgi:hypothetical protein
VTVAKHFAAIDSRKNTLILKSILCGETGRRSDLDQTARIDMESAVPGAVPLGADLAVKRRWTLGQSAEDSKKMTAGEGGHGYSVSRTDELALTDFSMSGRGDR